MVGPERTKSDKEFFRLLGGPENDENAAHGDAPSPLKAQIYSLLVAEQQKSGPLLGLRETEAAGHLLCAWEKLMAAAPIGENGKQMFHCHLCHARLLAEHFENPPIAWAHCPYLDFKKR